MRALRLRAALTLVLLVLAACDAPTIPARGGAYGFALQDGSVQRVLHWPLGAQIRVAAVSAGASAQNISDALDAGIAAWSGVALYGEYQLRRVDSPADADVIVTGTDALVLPVSVAACSPSGPGDAVTTFCLTTDRTRVQPFAPANGSGATHVRFVVTVLGSVASGDASRARRLVAHELGHVLGIAQHSPNPGDLMASPPPTDHPSAADVATLLKLYHTPATVMP